MHILFSLFIIHQQGLLPIQHKEFTHSHMFIHRILKTYDDDDDDFYMVFIKKEVEIKSL